MKSQTISHTCIGCVEYTWNWHIVPDKCIGSGKGSLRPCKHYSSITTKEAKKRWKILGEPQLNNNANAPIYRQHQGKKNER